MNIRVCCPRECRIASRLILLALVVLALAPAAPAAAQGDLNASAVALGMQRVFPADGGADDVFGSAIAVSGNVMVVGAPDAAIDSKAKQGAAYLYGRNVGGAGNWGLIAKLVAEDGQANERFGYSVAIHGATVVVGAPQSKVGANIWQGAAYVFERDAGGPNAWAQVKKLVAPGGLASDRFGWSTAIHGATVVVGAAFARVDGKTAQGAAYVFGRNAAGPGEWGLIKKLTADDGVASDLFGRSVGIDGATIVVGASGVTTDGHADAGAAYLFARDAGGADNWGQSQKLAADVPEASSFFGASSAVSGNSVVIGATAAVAGTFGKLGAAYVFERHDAAWSFVKRLVAGEGWGGEMFGCSVSMSDATIVVGAYRASAGQPQQGAAYVFGRNAAGANAWGMITKLYDPAGQPSDKFGSAVSVDGTTIVAGASNALGPDATASGAAYSFAPYSVRVNGAGPRYMDKAGNLWLADRAWPALGPGTLTWGYTNGIGRTSAQPIAGTPDDRLYQSERLFTGAARPGYQFVVPNGHYRITFKYAETYWSAAGKRVFTVMAENKICFANYDPFVAAGGARNTAAPDKVCYVDVNDGVLDIGFISVAGQAKSSAIAIQQLLQ